MNPRYVEGVALMLIGLLALCLYLGLALGTLTPYEPLGYSILPENPTYVALMYNVTARSAQSNETAWALLLVRFNETRSTVSKGVMYYLTYVTRAGGSPNLSELLTGLSYGPAQVPEGGQPYVAYEGELSELPHATIFASGSPYPVAVLRHNFTTTTGLIAREVVYYSLSTGFLIRGDVSYLFLNGTPLLTMTYRLYNVTLLQGRSGVLMTVRAPLLYLSLGVLASVAAAGLTAGLYRLLSGAA